MINVPLADCFPLAHRSSMFDVCSGFIDPADLEVVARCFNAQANVDQGEWTESSRWAALCIAAHSAQLSCSVGLETSARGGFGR